MWADSEVRSVVSQPKCNLIRLFSWIPDDGRAPATGIRRVDLEPTDANISPVSVRLALFKVAGYPGNVSCRAGSGHLLNRAKSARVQKNVEPRGQNPVEPLDILSQRFLEPVETFFSGCDGVGVRRNKNWILGINTVSKIIQQTT